MSTEKVDTEVPSAVAGSCGRCMWPRETVRSVAIAVITAATADEPIDDTPAAATRRGPDSRGHGAADTEPDSTAPRAAAAVPSPASPHDTRAGPGRDGFCRRSCELCSTNMDSRPTRSQEAETVGASRGTTCSPRPRTDAPVRRPGDPKAARRRPRCRRLTSTRAGSDDDVVEFSKAQRATAEHMVRSLATGAHTLVATEVDYHPVDPGPPPRQARLPAVRRPGDGDALREFGHLNASVGDDELIVHRRIHLGIAVDVGFEALVVPVVKDAGDVRLVALAEAMAAQADKARHKRLTGDDLSGGTFTITNVGAYGTVVTAPVINQPQVAILSTDSVRMRPTAVRDAGSGLSLSIRSETCASASTTAPSTAPMPRRSSPACADSSRPAIGNRSSDGRRRRQRRHHPDSPDTVHGFPVDELIDDFRLACVSRAIDDREINMQKQSRVFFQISGAGHEALGLALARRCAQATGSSRTPRPGARPRPRGHAEGDPPAGGRLGRGPGQRGPPDADHWGHTAVNLVTQSSPTGSQCIPAVGSAEAARYIVRRPELGLPAHGDELTYVSLGAGVQRGRVLGEPEHRLQPAPARAVRGTRQRIRHLGADDRSAARAGGRSGGGLRGLEVHRLDGTDYFCIHGIGPRP